MKDDFDASPPVLSRERARALRAARTEAKQASLHALLLLPISVPSWLSALAFHSWFLTPLRSAVILLLASLLSLLALALFVPLLLPGCGVKSAPIPPQMAKPAAITDLHASPDPAGINLSWSRPMHYVSGHSLRDLGGFLILRGEDHKPFEPLVELPVSDQERFSPQRSFSYVDGETQVGSSYRYQIVSRTIDGYASAPSNEVEFTRVRPGRGPKLENFTLPTPTPLPTNLP